MFRGKSKAYSFLLSVIRWMGCVAGLLIVVTYAVVLPAQAEGLREALTSAYQNNPELRADRARQRAQDEAVAQAQSGYRPTVSANIFAGSRKTTSKPKQASDDRTDPHGYGVSLTQPIFRGFQTVNAIRGARASVEAGRHNLRSVEQSVLSDAATAYLTVVRTRKVLQLRLNNQSVLAKQLRATKDRFAVGEVTKTDVAQAEATFSGARSSVATARADVKTAEADFERVVGHKAGKLFQPSMLRRFLPSTLTNALSVGEREHPSILTAMFQEKAALFTIDQIKGEQLPRVDLEATFDHTDQSSKFVDENNVTTVTGRVTIPLYQSGSVYSRIREAKQIALQRRAQIQQAQRQVRASIISAWGQYTSLRSQMKSDGAEVQARKVALSGVREEEKVGQRTILDVLDAEQDYLNALVQIATTKTNLRIAEYNLLSSMGRLEAVRLNLPVYHYNPNENLQIVDRKWRGDEIGHEELDQRRAVDLDYVRDRFRALNQGHK